MDGWTWCYEGYDPDGERLREVLCTVGNGYLASRGAAPESRADGTHYPGTYAAGIYNRRASEVAGHQVDNESLVNLPNWLPLTFRIDGGPWFDLDSVDILEYRQVLDLRQATLRRHVRFRDDHGRTTTVSQRRFVHMRFRHACVLECTLTAEDWSGHLAVRSALDGRVRNTLVGRYRGLATDHLRPVRTAELSEDAVLLEVQTNQSHVRVAMAARTTVHGGGEPDHHRQLVTREGWIGHDIGVRLDAGDQVRFEKVVTVFTSRDSAVLEPAEEAARWLPRLGDAESLLADHVTTWRHLWERFFFDTGDGAGARELLRIVRLHLLHVLQTVSLNTLDLDVGVPPRGLHGEAYRGHILWDELFVLPILNLRLPVVSRALLLYRHRRLPEARQAALAAGYAGAMYPWQSGSDGREESQRLHLNPASGRWIPDPTHLQRHVGIAVAYNVWQYYQTTGDQEFLTHHGAEMLLETARFWASFANHDAERDRYVVRGVMGPDEFHSGRPGADHDGIDNNAYTNVMAVWVLLRARDALDALSAQSRTALLDTLGISADELDRWDHITRRMFVPFHDGVISQFEGYEHLDELDWDAYRRRYGNIQRLDRLLEAEGDDVNRYKASKQADVLMLFYLLSADELRDLLERLGYRLDPPMIRRTVDYYVARTSHGSTLSAVVHAWVLTRAHRERGVELFYRALRADVDVHGGTTAEGIHLAAMAGSVDLLQRCFAGIETRRGQLFLNPYWPRSLRALCFGIRYRGHVLTVRISGRTVRIASAPGGQQPIRVSCRTMMAELSPGSRLSFAF
ncbi:glycoside hydrolase family 65 protein [Micromonospora sp. MS34]|uniref:glycoside hydrolase family 65 protein n=1 Tax=Micromonospora sp. MS34 TaxID=3385971 RepID=UPI0039A099AA